MGVQLQHLSSVALEGGLPQAVACMVQPASSNYDRRGVKVPYPGSGPRLEQAALVA